MPQKTLTLDGTRTVGTAVVAQYTTANGIGINIFSIAHTSPGGFYTAPFFLPPDLDVTRPIDCYLRIRNPVNAGLPAKLIAFQYNISTVILGGAPAVDVVNWYFPTPGNWPVDETADLLLDSSDDPKGHTILGNTLAPGTLLGIRVRRNSLDTLDTYDSPIYLVAGIRLVYYLRCQFLPC